MTEFISGRFRVLALLLTLGLFAAACGGDGSTDAGEQGGSDAEINGKIVADGSSTVAPLSEAIAEEYRAEQGGVDVTVGTSGTGGGFEKFCAGETDISNASRPIKDEERAACEDGGVEFTEFRVGLDGLSVVTSAENDFLECLSYEDLKKIWAEPGVKTWDEVDPDFPDEEVAIFAPDAESGTYDFFGEEILGDDDNAPKPITDYTASSDDNVLVKGIEGEANSFGYFGFAYFQENEEGLKAIQVSEEEGGECIEVSPETIEDGSYPLSRPLFLYVKNSSLEQDHVKDFVRFYLETTPEVIEEVGYVAAPDADYQKGLDALGAE